MSATNENARLETFCDGVFAIAITLLVLEIKVPHLDTIHSATDLWIALGRLWPSFFAFTLSFLIILIGWVGHHAAFKLIDKSSPRFMYANAFLLFTVVIFPFPTAIMAEYLYTDYAQPAIVTFNLACILHNISWNVFLGAQLRPKDLSKSHGARIGIINGIKYMRAGFFIYASLAILSWRFPYTSLVLNTILWVLWLCLGVSYHKEKINLGKLAGH